MSIGSVLAEAWGSLTSHRLRSTLTALSVAFGAAVLFILMSYGTAVPAATSDMLHRMGSTEFVVEPERTSGPGGGARGGRRVQVRYDDLAAIRRACPSIDGIAASYDPTRGQPVFTAGRSWPWATVDGVTSEYADITQLRILAGRWFTPEEEVGAVDVALLNAPLAEGLFDGRSPLGEFIDFGARRFTIIGVYETEATFAYGLYIPYTTSMDMGETGGRFVSALAFRPRSPAQARQAISEIRQALGSLYSFDPDDPRALDIRENTAFIERVRGVAMGLEWLVLTIAGLALVLGCLGAANVVGIAVSERTAELGLRKALGAKRGRLRAEVLAETLILCVGGGGLGVALGAAATSWLGALQLADEARLEPSVDAVLLAASLVVLVITATVSGLPAANRAAALDPVEALREP